MTEQRPTRLRLEDIEPQKPLLRLTHILPLLPVSRRTVWQWVADGKFPRPHKLGTKIAVWRREEIQQWLDARHV